MSLGKEHAAPKDLLSHGCYVISHKIPQLQLKSKFARVRVGPAGTIPAESGVPGTFGGLAPQQVVFPGGNIDFT